VDERSSPSVKSDSMRYAFYVTPFVCVFGGAFFLATALFIQKDREKAEKIAKGKLFYVNYNYLRDLGINWFHF
jgi:hypothetical protein